MLLHYTHIAVQCFPNEIYYGHIIHEVKYRVLTAVPAALPFILEL